LVPWNPHSYCLVQINSQSVNYLYHSWILNYELKFLPRLLYSVGKIHVIHCFLHQMHYFVVLQIITLYDTTVPCYIQLVCCSQLFCKIHIEIWTITFSLQYMHEGILIILNTQGLLSCEHNITVLESFWIFLAPKPWIWMRKLLNIFSWS
jgi:hypothetical protein